MENNVYKKLQQARVELQDMKLKKTGTNQNMSYFELGDFLPAVNALCDKHGLFTKLNIVNAKTELAVLSVYNTQKPDEKIDFTCPTAEASLPKGQAIQNLGAKITYLRRYMLMTAFEIAESEIVDAVNRDIANEVEKGDVDKIKSAGSLEELTKVCGQLKTKYKVKLIEPLYNSRKVELEQKEAK